MRKKQYVCVILEEVCTQGSHLAEVLVDNGYLPISEELQRLLGPLKTVAHRIGLDGGFLGDSVIWYYGDKLRDAVRDVSDWVVSKEPEEVQQPLLDAFVKFDTTLQHAVFIAELTSTGED